MTERTTKRKVLKGEIKDKCMEFNNPEQLIKKYSEEIDLVEQEEKDPETQLTNEQLLIVLGERIGTKEIELDEISKYLFIVEEINKKDKLKLFLFDGKIEPNRIDEEKSHE